MSDIKPAHQINSTILPDGTTICINDHVYLAPEHLGEPYYIGRVMEFCTSRKRNGLQARIAWFNRPKDVINRKSADPCLLVATMHSDINPVSSIRGKCTVTHKYYIPQDQMDTYRKTEDNFYYNQLYDRYIQRVYDVVPCETVQNVPMDTLEALKQRYQFIVVEQGKAADLTVARRICCVCQEWCQSAVSVKCAACQKSYHMACLNPPLVRKPSKGFAWQCAFCTRQEAFSSASSPQSAANSTNMSNANSRVTSPSLSNDKENENNDNTNRAETKRQTRYTRSQVLRVQPKQAYTLLSKEDTKLSSTDGFSPISDTSIKLKLKNKGLKSQQVKMTHMWPFRYFGVNTHIRDILDVDDRIYPRVKSRIGTKYQATIPELGSVNSHRSLSPASEAQSPSSSVGKTGHSSKLKKSEKRSKGQKNATQNTNGSKRSAESSPKDASASLPNLDDMPPQLPVRGSDDTVTYLYRPNVLSESEMDTYMEKVKAIENTPLPTHSSDFIDRALLELEHNNYQTDVAYHKMCQLTEVDFKHLVEWTPREIEAFEQSIRDHGHDLNYAKSSVKTKSMADIVRFFYQWKKTDRYEPIYSEWTKIYRPLKRFKKFPRKVEEDKENDDTNLEKEAREEEQGLNMTTEEESDPTIVPRATYSTKSYQCMNCLTHKSHIWRRSPSDIDRKRQVFNKVLCNDCGVFWLKYAKTKPISPEVRIANISAISAQQTASTGSVKNEEDKKRKRLSEYPSKTSKKTKEDRLVLKFEPSACQVCARMGPTDRLYTCYDCGLSVHSDCYGIRSKADKIGWRCDPCDNQYNPVSSYVYECVLCFNQSSKCQTLKPTAGYYWAHIQCATFIPEVKFVNTTTLSPVEYIGCVNMARLNADCQLCQDKRGACVACSECKKAVHVQCAIDNQFRLAFEIQSIAQSNSAYAKCPVVPAGLFKEDSPSGLMVPQVWCPSHNLSNRKLIELETRTTDENQESSLMVFAKHYKHVTEGSTPAMRRFRATHHLSNPSHSTKIPSPKEAMLEAMHIEDYVTSPPASKPLKISISLPTKTTKEASKFKRTCASDGCRVQHTPIWWDIDPNSPSDLKICHRCYKKKNP
ncbi:Lid2 complex component snt2 [Choanephora cucurbitarum]|uniref:Lid2 complex component snt2 n=1 Tax=Choanephora cucurbitarum TaxID=101091 RepID=A0A1C7NCE7_9FUNG|nr:Lid2 complex component snt2 [Choanephora cucurbitarum]